MRTLYKRRQFLGNVVILTAAGQLTGWGYSPAAPAGLFQKKAVMLHELTLDHFAAHLNSRFALELEPGKWIDLELVEAVSLSAGAGSRPPHLAPRGPFSVLFLARADSAMTQRIYRIRHPSMGEMEIFLVPIGRDPSGLKCEAIFN